MATILAHTHNSLSDINLSDKVAFTLVLHRADGSIESVDSDELPSIADETSAISMAMNSLRSEEDYCDVFHYGEEHGTAEYLNMNPNSWFGTAQVVYSTAF